MELTEIAQWTPIRLILQPPEAALDWCDLRGIAFEEPFFDQTVARWTGGAAPRPVIRTSLQELAALDGEPSLDPAGLIFHMSRCGSTLLSRLLSTLPGVVVASEPAPINALLEADPELVDEAARATVLRLLIRALGRIRHGGERRFVVKLSSWNVRLLPLFRLAFPDTPRVFVHRRPVEVMASILAGPPGWMQLRHYPRRAEYLFGLDPLAVPAMPAEEFCARVLASMLDAWTEAIDPWATTVDYRDLPGAAWQRIAPALDLPTTPEDVARMADEARYYAKDPVRRVFAGETGAARPVPPVVRDLAERLVEPAYARLAAS